MNQRTDFEFYSWIKCDETAALRTIEDFPVVEEISIKKKYLSEARTFDPLRLCDELDQRWLESWGILEPGLVRSAGGSLLGETKQELPSTGSLYVGAEVLKVARKKWDEIFIHEFVFLFGFATEPGALVQVLAKTESRYQKTGEIERHQLLTVDGKNKLAEVMGKKVSTPRGLDKPWVSRS